MRCAVAGREIEARKDLLSAVYPRTFRAIHILSLHRT